MKKLPINIMLNFIERRRFSLNMYKNNIIVTYTLIISIRKDYLLVPKL